MTRPLSQAERLDLERLTKDAVALLDEYAPEHQKPGDYTLAIAAAHWDVGLSNAEKRLTQMVKEKRVLLLHDVQLSNGRRGRVWRPVRKGKK